MKKHAQIEPSSTEDWGVALAYEMAKVWDIQNFIFHALELV